MGVFLCGSLCLRGALCLAAVRTFALPIVSMGGRSQPFIQECCWSPKQKTDYYSELAEPARTDVHICNRHKPSIRLTKA